MKPSDSTRLIDDENDLRACAELHEAWTGGPRGAGDISVSDYLFGEEVQLP